MHTPDKGKTRTRSAAARKIFAVCALSAASLGAQADAEFWHGIAGAVAPLVLDGSLSGKNTENGYGRAIMRIGAGTAAASLVDGKGESAAVGAAASWGADQLIRVFETPRVTPAPTYGAPTHAAPTYAAPTPVRIAPTPTYVAPVRAAPAGQVIAEGLGRNPQTGLNEIEICTRAAPGVDWECHLQTTRGNATYERMLRDLNTRGAGNYVSR